MKKHLLILMCSLIFIQCTQVGGSDDNTGGPRPKPGAMPIGTQQAFQKGLRNTDSGDFQSAIQDFTAAINLYPNEGRFWFARGALRADVTDFEGAISDFTMAIKLDSNSALFWSERGKLFSIMGNYSSGINDLSKAIDLEPYNDSYFLRRASMKKNIGDDNGACLDARIAVKLKESLTRGSFYLDGKLKSGDFLDSDCSSETSFGSWLPFSFYLTAQPGFEIEYSLADAYAEGWTARRPDDYSSDLYDMIKVEGFNLFRLKEIE